MCDPKVSDRTGNRWIWWLTDELYLYFNCKLTRCIGAIDKGPELPSTQASLREPSSKYFVDTARHAELRSPGGLLGMLRSQTAQVREVWTVKEEE